MTDSPVEFLTIGHSDRSIAEFLELLEAARVDVVVDVRRLPGSRKYPWFDQDALTASLQERAICYVHLTALTGRRPKQPDVPDEVNALWQNRSFHNYADFTLSDEFAEGLAQLRSLDAEVPAMLCSEAVWWRCHRRLIADQLLAAGETVRHIMGPGDPKPATLTPGAVVKNGRATYPAATD
ncbi:DUF488 family protein [Dermacoccus barathri]|uniref:DUF488 domain-containing protein n=1 Tax=Dermacoccus barathri TaxID=322601 RepID=A0ABN2B669_9MICO